MDFFKIIRIIILEFFLVLLFLCNKTLFFVFGFYIYFFVGVYRYTFAFGYSIAISSNAVIRLRMYLRYRIYAVKFTAVVFTLSRKYLPPFYKFCRNFAARPCDKNKNKNKNKIKIKIKKQKFAFLFFFRLFPFRAAIRTKMKIFSVKFSALRAFP